MSAVEAFNPVCFSPWYIEILKRTHFEPKTQDQVKEWEYRVTELFLKEEEAWPIAENYLERLGITVKDMDMRRMALALSKKMYSEFLRPNEKTVDTQMDSLQMYIELGLTTRESPFVMDGEDHADDTEDLLERPPFLESSVSDWSSKLRMFFFVDPCKETEAAAIEVLRQMRQVRRKRDSPMSKTSHPSFILAKTILSVSEPCMSVAKKSEFLKGSFRKYQWREALLLCLATLSNEFVPKDPELIRKEMDSMREKSNEFLEISVREFLLRISQEDLIPIAIKPHSIFFLSSKQNFVAAYLDWLYHSASRAGVKLGLGDAEKMYNGICRTTEESWNMWNISPELKEILSLSRKLRNLRKAWKASAHRNKNRDRTPSGPCRKCGDLEDSQKCVQYLPVEDLEVGKVNKKWLIPRDDVVLSGDLSNKCVPLNELNFEYIEFNEEIYDRCGRLVIHLVRADTGKEVSGIIFGLLDEVSVKNFAENQAKIKCLTTKLRRGKIFSDFSDISRGGMHPVGFRQPAGGRPGDGYGPYPASEVLCLEDIRTLFSYASDIECILAHIEPHAPGVVRELRDLGEEASVLGHYGVTAFHCWNYISPQHCDKDDSWTVSYQLFKEGCREDEFNFAFSRWGKILKTVKNCVWWFRGEDLHGTVIARPSTLGRGGVLSQGVGITMPHRTLQAAKRYVQARWSWKELCKYWGANEM